MLHPARHFGRPATTVFGGDRCLALFLPGDMTGIRYPDMLIAFDADPEAYHRSNGYIISEQSKPPDFVLEIGSPSTGHVDAGAKRDSTRRWASPSTGASTRRPAATAPVWPGTVWWTGSTGRLPLRSWRRTSCRAAVRFCIWTCAGNTGN